MRLIEIKEKIEDGISKLWPTVNCDVVLSPLLDSARGDVQSECFLHLAEQLKIKPEVVGHQVMEQVFSSSNLEWRLEEGFLNLRLEDKSFQDLKEDSYKSSLSAVSVIISPPTASAKNCSYMRLLALALCQYSILKDLGAKVELSGYGIHRELNGSTDSLADLFRLFAACRPREDKPEILKDEIQAELEGAKGERTFLWLAPRFLPKKCFVSFFRESVAEDDSISLECPEQKWISANDTDFNINDLKKWSDSQVYALIAYLCGEIGGQDLDFYVPQANENSNILWFLDVSLKRLRLLMEKVEGVDSSSIKSVPQISEEDRILWHRVKFLSLFFKQAGDCGKVREFFTALSDLLRLCSRKFNDPDLRMRCEKGEINQMEIQILSGVDAVLSDIIETWELFGLWSILAANDNA